MFDFVELCAGVGLTELGLEQAGLNCVYSAEIDKYCEITYNANHLKPLTTRCSTKEITELPPHQIISAGFPCQSFSITGVTKRHELGRPTGFNDPKTGYVFFEIARLAQKYNTPILFLENVTGLLTHDKGNTFRTILETLCNLGYNITYKVIDAVMLVPQHRKRVYLVATRAGLPEFRWPTIPDLSPRLGMILEDTIDSKYFITQDALNRYAKRQQANKNAKRGFRYSLLTPDCVTPTLTAHYHKGKRDILIKTKQGTRCLTPRECARLMGAPDIFKFPLSDTHIYKQMGNGAVIPIIRYLGQALAEVATYV